MADIKFELCARWWVRLTDGNKWLQFVKPLYMTTAAVEHHSYITKLKTKRLAIYMSPAVTVPPLYSSRVCRGGAKFFTLAHFVLDIGM